MNFFAEKNITRSTYICALHWPGESSFIDEECVDEKCAVIDTHICVNPSGKLVSDQGSQTIYSKFELSAKVESMVLRIDVFTTVRYHYSNTDHDYHIRLGPQALIAVMRTNCTISQVTLTADLYFLSHYITD